ncbi:hypothetical protein HanRHA438_Chr17g0806081 [Helianthus annuus]|nr:hypothetical protein HanHA89_Chr17g0700691 [Helianthus annuus]KAJ0631921.1 hypothetical protein HanLR1_Chr17g0659311 [Helianthus annuus]KAJ0825701.1 hypothetical protein HanRHA438_Chr17g0806081 [Helianthus annuus]
MAETQPKRPREDQQHHVFSHEVEPTKHHKTCNNYTQILSILDDNTEEDQHQETTQRLTEFFTSLQQELIISSSSDPLPEEKQQEVEDGEEKERVIIRHLLEASDDELGIPDDGYGVLEGNDAAGCCESLCDELLGLEDEAANYCSLLQSELIM